MRKGFCNICYSKDTCKRLCKIVVAELIKKGIYAEDPETGRLIPKSIEVELVFMDEYEVEREWARIVRLYGN